MTAQEKAEHEAAARKKEEERLKALAQKKAQELWNSMPWWRKIIAYVGLFFTALWHYIAQGWSAIAGLFSSSQKVATKAVAQVVKK